MLFEERQCWQHNHLTYWDSIWANRSCRSWSNSLSAIVIVYDRLFCVSTSNINAGAKKKPNQIDRFAKQNKNAEDTNDIRNVTKVASGSVPKQKLNTAIEICVRQEEKKSTNNLINSLTKQVRPTAMTFVRLCWMTVCYGSGRSSRILSLPP